MTHYVVFGTLIGISAGLSPGPLMALVISETLQRDIRSGIKVALAPIFSDLPIVVLTLWLFSEIADFQNIFGAISLVGSVFLFHMGYENITSREQNTGTDPTRLGSSTRGIIVNFLSPHPYLFWMTVGAPTTIKAYSENHHSASAFIICFYTFLVGSKISIAILTGKAKTFLTGKVYIYTIRLLGVSLCILAIFLLSDGITLLRTK